jgi:AmmeMemoRadiSam system protein B
MANVRPSAIAGSWYPGSEAALRKTVEGLLDRVAGEVAGRAGAGSARVFALVSPHAGYAYSGPTAAHAFARVRGTPFKRVVLLGPLHRLIPGSALGPFMVPEEDAYRTPLGAVPVDRDFIGALGERVRLTPVRRDAEHALEIELPFLQVALPGFALVPIMLGEHIADPGSASRLRQLAAALAALADPETLIVASTDLSHLDSYAAVRRTDKRLVELVAAYDVDGLEAALHRDEVQACGASGLVAALRAAHILGARRTEVLDYAASGDVTGDKRPGVYTVGYLAAAATA